MLWPEKKYKINLNLIEQDFGDWEGKDYSKIPNIGFLNNFNLYKFAPPNGESQRDLSSRVKLEILEIAKRSKKKKFSCYCSRRFNKNRNKPNNEM